MVETHADSARELVSNEYVSVDEDTFVGEAIREFREFSPVDEETTVYFLYVVDDQGNLTGVASFRELLNADEDEFVTDIMETDLVTIDADAHPEKVSATMSDTDFQALPVVDDGTLVGIVRADDMVDVVEEEATEDILKSAGMTFRDIEASRSTAILESSVPKILWLRLPWLIVALVGGLLAGAVIEEYEATLETAVALAFFIPVIMDMGGNVGTQASTIFVRGLALGHIDDRNAMRHFAREGLIGLAIGLIIGSLGAGAAYGWRVLRGDPHAETIAIVVFIALVAVCVVASVVGYVIPWLANKAGYDPAAVSDPLVTTIKDVTALLIYFGLATFLLAELL
ncbi:MgtE family transport protein [Natronomonas pharaonis DSM 2160]|uniref:Magnesium transporter MgtE n=1 Tax=Natronomonas pharaonis (strain ATCC 35678 / DSM 2160 / CIP 103997 / JCM 8858 / NBRC 14720 / NCIMB 2260 / Gabara) TaxID=348780 RepID=A0A1U7EW96_NATPD|nr:magnesium transporter [Natronomonas pharaonis]CAI49327.1 MgtE family transport protein [Natronomonas pharaonis DSM 2160]